MWTETFETWLPHSLFAGFYETGWQYDEEYEAEFLAEEFGVERDDAINWLCDNVDYKRYEKDVAKNVVDVLFGKILKEKGEPFLINIGEPEDLFPSVEFLGIDSPSYYNYRNDYIDIKIVVNMTEFLWLMLYKNNNDIMSLKEDIRNRYRPVSGYSPGISNNFKDWVEETKNFTRLDGEYMSYFLDILFCEMIEFEETPQFYLRETVMESIYLGDYYDFVKFKKDFKIKENNYESKSF